MRAMAILYIGPHRNPDFQSDYQLSPILAPDRLLAQFPPLLMSCGEKDPFVDDTLIFAGRVREAKRARPVELERIIAGKSSQFGEGLRMSNYDGDQPTLRALRRERERLAGESEEDWVRMHIFSEWSHGYLQMPTLMHEVRGVLDDLADWMDDAFARHQWAADRGQRAGIPPTLGLRLEDDSQGPATSPSPSRSPPRTARLSTRRFTKTVRGAGEETDGLASSTASETEFDMDEVLTFAPKRRSPPSSFAGSRHDSAGSSVGMARSSIPSTPALLNGHANGHAYGDRDLRRAAMMQHDSTAATPSGETQPSSTSSSPPPVTPNIKRPGSLTPGNSPMPTKGGQRISEVELMRRRRLLDAHLVSAQQSQDSVLR